jgi:putative alpha-1,2-mannosidase
MGFYPVTPGSQVYMIGSPLFGKVTVKAGDHSFTILAHNNSPDNRYIRSVTLNGEPLNRSWLLHNEIINGGLLEFNMGPQPDKNRGRNFKNLPLLTPEN